MDFKDAVFIWLRRGPVCGIFLSWVWIARGCRAQLFVRGKLVCLFTVFVSNIELPLPRAAVDRHCS
jgi:hypothetical protein